MIEEEEKQAMWTQKQEGGDRTLGSAARAAGADGSDGSETPSASRHAIEAMEKLRLGIDQASQAIRDLTQVSEGWAQSAQGRAREMAKELRGQGERAVGTVSQQIEHNPLTSVTIAFAVGFLCAALTRR